MKQFPNQFILACSVLVAATVVACTANAAVVQSDDDVRRLQVSAASMNAIDRLRDDIASQRLNPQMTVAQFLDAVNGWPTLHAELTKARQLGGPRWLDEQTAQVRLEIPASRVAAVLVQLARDNARTTPILPEVMIRILEPWRDRAFIATGTAISPRSIGKLRPRESSRWGEISDDARQEAVSAARRDACSRVTSSIAEISVTDGRALGSYLQQPAVATRINQWLDDRPATGVTFNETLVVEVALSVPPDEFAEIVTRSLRETDESLSDDRLAELRREIAARTFGAVGKSELRPNSVEARRPIVFIPPTPPVWADQQLHAEATVDYAGSKLRTARAAETKAFFNLRLRIDELPINANQSIGEAAGLSRPFNEAIERSMLRARVAKVDYLSDERVNVKVYLDGRVLWEEIRSGAGR
jgi:hypothetical protein